jgi:4,5-DOPA dioxygenase extradiol
LSRRIPRAWFADVCLGGDDHAAALREFGRQYSDARAIVIVSERWQTRSQVRASAWEHAPLVYDFGGFPDELYHIEYPEPGDPTLAARIAETVPELRRRLDYGAWVPLRLAWPEATIPVVQVSVPVVSPGRLWRWAGVFARCGEEGIVVAGSGGIVHNLGLVHFADKNAPVDSWAAEFDRWVADRVARQDVEGLLRYRTQAPHADLAVPTPEHFDPLFLTMGAAWPEEQVGTVYEGFPHGNLSMRSFAFF